MYACGIKREREHIYMKKKKILHHQSIIIQLHAIVYK